MTFILGVMGMMTLNTMFVSLGGGYKKFPPVNDKSEEDKDKKLFLFD